MQNFIYKLIGLSIIGYFFQSPILALKLSEINSSAEEILYSAEPISSHKITTVLRKIEEPETNPAMKQSKVRDLKESQEVIKKTAQSLQEEIPSLEELGCGEVSKRINEFLSLIKTPDNYINLISLSYLLEAMKAEMPD